jgi:hypothetical protein
VPEPAPVTSVEVPLCPDCGHHRGPHQPDCPCFCHHHAPVTEWVPATELANRIRDTMRIQHGMCDSRACPLSFITAEDVQEVLDERDRLVAVCTCRPMGSGEAPPVPDRDCPAHGEPVAQRGRPRECTCYGYGGAPPARDCPAHGEQAW